MANYIPTGNPVSETRGMSAVIRDEFQLIADSISGKPNSSGGTLENPVITGGVNILGDTVINGPTTVNSTLTVAGDALFEEDVFIVGNLTVGGLSTITVPTAIAGDSSLTAASTEFVQQALTPLQDQIDLIDGGAAGLAADLSAINDSIDGLDVRVTALEGAAAGTEIPPLLGNENKLLSNNGTILTWINPPSATGETIFQGSGSGTYTITNETIILLTLTGDTSIAFPAPEVGLSFTILVAQNATGGWAVTWDVLAKWPLGAVVTIPSAPNSGSRFNFVCDGTSFIGSVSGAGYTGL